MKNLLSFVLLLLAMAALSPAQDAPPTVNYRIKPVPGADRTDLEVSVSMKTSNTAPVIFGLPKDRYGVPDIHRFVRSFEGEDGTIVAPGKNAAERSVRASTNGEIRLKFTLSYDPALLENNTYAPNVSPKHFHIAGCQFLLHIGDASEKYHIVVEIADLPAEWKAYSSLGPDPRRSETTATVEDIGTSSAFGGGKSAANGFTFHGKPVSIFIQGKFDIPADAMFASIRKIVTLQRDFFSDYDQEFYNVVILPKDGNVAGVRIPNLFSCFLKSDITALQLYGLLSHEMFHNWLTASIIRPKESETSLRYIWFYEGINDYISRRLLLDAKIITRAQFAYLANRDIINIADNPNRSATYSDMKAAADAGKYNQAFNKLSYYRGGLIGLNWDAQIRKTGKGHSLGGLIKRVYAESVKKNGISEEELFDLAAEYGIDAKRDFERYILAGESIPASPGALGADFVLRGSMVPSFRAGFTSVSGKVAAVEDGSAAFRAGLRPGMEIVKTENSNRFGNAWDPDLPYVVVVKFEGKEKRIEFFPHGDSMKLNLFRPSKTR